MIRILNKMIFASKSGLSPAHAHRQEWHDEIVVDQMDCIHCFSVLFLSSPVFPGLGFGTFPRHSADWLPGFHRA
jgi:hypothetical protein